MSNHSGFVIPDSPTTVEEVLRRYQAGETLFEGVEVREGSSFCGAKLPGVHFKDAFLHSVDFSNTDLRGAVFERTNVKCVDFRGADLRGACFRDVALCGSDFARANVDGITMDKATWSGAPVDPALLRQWTLPD